MASNYEEKSTPVYPTTIPYIELTDRVKGDPADLSIAGIFTGKINQVLQKIIDRLTWLKNNLLKSVTQSEYDALFTFTSAGSYSQILNSGTPTDGQLEINPTTDAIGVNPTSANVSTFTNHWKNGRKWKIGTWEFTLVSTSESGGVYSATFTTTAGTALTNATRPDKHYRSQHRIQTCSRIHCMP